MTIRFQSRIVLAMLATTLSLVVLAGTGWTRDPFAGGPPLVPPAPEDSESGEKWMLPEDSAPDGFWSDSDPAECDQFGKCDRCDEPCYTPCGCSYWYGRGEGVWLHRNRARPFSLSADDFSPQGNDPRPNREHIVLDTDDLDFDTEPGARITIGKFKDECTSWEATYLGFMEWSTSAASPINTDNDLVPFWGNATETIDTGNFQGSYQHWADYSSRLHSVEFNRRHWLNDTTSCFAGCRYIYINEEFNFHSQDVDPAVDPDDRGLYEVETGNRLTGLQIGGTKGWGLFCGRLQCGVEGRAGVFINYLEQESHLLNHDPPADPTTDLHTRNRDVAFSTAVEVGSFLQFYLKDNWTIRGGYFVFVVDGVALAPEQLDIPQWDNSREYLSDNGSIIFHGPHVGMSLAW